MTGPLLETSPPLGRVLVVGAGLMGTSVGLALRAHGVHVLLADRNPAAVALAAELGAGVPRTPDDPPTDLAVIAVPPQHVAPVLADLQTGHTAGGYTDLGSSKGEPQRAIEASGCRLDTFVGGHPLAGRERSGAGAARADLFDGRPWVLTPSAATSIETVAAARRLAELCGAIPVVMDPEEHDRAVALVSHAPQLVASLLAARLVAAPDEAVRLAGQGLRDVTRIAASDPDLWEQILASNAGPIADVLDAFAADLDVVIGALRKTAQSTTASLDRQTTVEVLCDVLVRGNAGRARIPGKHGQPPAAYVVVPVIVADRPGELARLLTDAGHAGVNVEDVAIEHSPGQPVGLVELSVRPSVADALAAALRSRGWSVHH